MVFLLLFIATLGYSQNWKTDFNQAKVEAMGQANYFGFFWFDWCAPCIKLDKTIWQSEV
jgi:thiol-disulfide isomerase/thioredoxin